MFTFISLWARPYWDLVEYNVTARWEDDPDAEPAYVSKAGTLRVPSDSTPEEVLLALAVSLRSAAVEAGGPYNASLPDAVS